MERIATTADDKVFVFSCIKDENIVITILNISPNDVDIELTNPIEKNDLKELFTQEEITNKYNLKVFWAYKVFKTE